MEFRADFLSVDSRCRKAKLLPDLGIHPCTVQRSYPCYLVVVLPLSSHSSSNLFFFFVAPLLIFFFFFSLFVLIVALWQSVLLRGMAQGDDVCGEAVFE